MNDFLFFIEMFRTLWHFLFTFYLFHTFRSIKHHLSSRLTFMQSRAFFTMPRFDGASARPVFRRPIARAVTTCTASRILWLPNPLKRNVPLCFVYASVQEKSKSVSAATSSSDISPRAVFDIKAEIRSNATLIHLLNRLVLY